MEAKEKILKEIEEIFRKDFNDPTLEINFNTTANDIEKWDSINNLVLISSIEEKFGITFPVDVIFDAEKVGDWCDYILKVSNEK